LNHFIELDYSEKTGKYYLVIHTGSRNLGKQVAEYYQNLAIKNNSGHSKEELKKLSQELTKRYKEEGRQKEIKYALQKLKEQFNHDNPVLPKDLCYLDGSDMQDYLHDMRLCQEFAVLNRELISLIILDKLKQKPGETFETVHNYINFRDGIIRKGAVSAREGEKLIIPMNMRDGSLICVGKGNADWNYSAPHGAGRLMSRTKAREILKMEDYKEDMKGIDTWSVSEGTIDEAPQAYKPMQEIIDCIEPTAEVIDIIKPVYNFKAQG
jgi:RNA-splicing ligase RtcB